MTDARPNERGGLAATVQPTHLDIPSRHILSTAFLQSEATSSTFYMRFHCFHSRSLSQVFGLGESKIQVFELYLKTQLG